MLKQLELKNNTQRKLHRRKFDKNGTTYIKNLHIKKLKRFIYKKKIFKRSLYIKKFESIYKKKITQKIIINSNLIPICS